MKEIELIDDFCKYLTKEGYIFKRELRKGSYHNDGYVDIVVKDFGILIAIEAKIQANKMVLSQASRNKVLFPLSYILISKKTKESHFKRYLLDCKALGIGIIIPGDNIFKVILKPKLSWHWKQLYFKILRNWIQDRIGRPINENSKELPENYSEEELKKLQPTYNWVEKTYDPFIIDWEKLGFTIHPKKEPIEFYNSKKQTYVKAKNHSLFEYLNK